jgi:hypothetical protein
LKVSDVLDALARHRAIVLKDKEIGAAAVQSAAQASGAAPIAEAGRFDYPAWAAGKAYAKGELFTYDGMVGFARQAVTAQAHQSPFSAGMEAVYGVRPKPDKYGVYPYVYNMAASVGMRVRDGDAVYACIQQIDLLIWPPSQVPAHFHIEI